MRAAAADRRGTGVASVLLAHILAEAKAIGLARLRSGPGAPRRAFPPGPAAVWKFGCSNTAAPSRLPAGSAQRFHDDGPVGRWWQCAGAGCPAGRCYRSITRSEDLRPDPDRAEPPPDVPATPIGTPMPAKTTKRPTPAKRRRRPFRWRAMTRAARPSRGVTSSSSISSLFRRSAERLDEAPS